MPNDSQRNTIVFIVSAALILIAYQFLVLGPQTQKRQALEAQNQAVAASTVASGPGAPGVPGVAVPTQLSRAEALAATPRVQVNTPNLTGSIALTGARIDDLLLSKYRQTTNAKSPPVELFRPRGAQYGYYADFGWAGVNVPGLPGEDTVWTLQQGSVLSPGRPVVLAYDNGQGLVFTRKIEVDDKYMFTLTDAVTNRGPAPVQLVPYGKIVRQDVPADLGKNQIVHEGAIGVFNRDGKSLYEHFKYGKWKKDPPQETFDATGGWLGVTDKYWAALIVPRQGQATRSQFRVTPAGGTLIYDANYTGAQRPVAPGATITETTRLFAGAKTVPLLREYEKNLNIPRFDDAVDWGMFYFFTRPIFLFLEMLYRFIGNFGLAIMALTVVVKVLFFPLANKSYESLTKMKKAQPELEKIKKRNEGDPAKQQQEMMALYAKEKINPFMGCLPVLIQIPVFFSLYKVFTVTIEMRHAPFYGWINDLSARDPTSLFTAFGLAPWNVAATPLIGNLLNGPLHLGVWPIIMGFTMWLQQAMSPPQGVDPIQQKIFAWFPVILTLTLSNVAAGLVIYWSWNNLLSILQQYFIMRRFKVDNPIDDFLAKMTGKPKPSETV